MCVDINTCMLGARRFEQFLQLFGVYCPATFSKVMPACHFVSTESVCNVAGTLAAVKLAGQPASPLASVTRASGRKLLQSISRQGATIIRSFALHQRRSTF